MKKAAYYILLICIYFSATAKLHAQSERNCFYAEVKSEGTNEKIFITFQKDGKNVSADVKKEMVKAGNTYSLSWEMDGTIDGDKITFVVPQGTIDTFKNDNNPIQGPKPVESWILKNNELIVDGKILKIVACK